MASLGFIGPPLNLGPPLIPKLQVPPLQKRGEGGGCAQFNFDWDWQTETWAINKVITYSTPRSLEFKSFPVFPLWPESSI